MSEIAIYQPANEVVLASSSPRGELDDWIMVADQVVRLAEVICRSPFVPDGLRGSAPATAAAILTGRELGIPPMTSLANIHVIHGKPGLSALVMRALVMREGHDWEEVEANNTRVVLRGKRKGSSTWTTASFSTADASIAKLQLGGYPQDKLYARASARLARRAFSDIVAGMPHSIEELEDGFTDSEDGTAASETVPDEKPPADKPRTAQRRTRTAATPAPSPAPKADAPPPADSGLPPLPGEDEAPPPPAEPAAPAAAPDGGANDIPGSITGPQLTRIWATLTSDFGFAGTDGDKEAARVACGVIIDRDITSTKELSFNDAKAIIDTLGHWQHGAETGGGSPRDYMMDALQRIEEARDGQVHGGQQ